MLGAYSEVAQEAAAVKSGELRELHESLEVKLHSARADIAAKMHRAQRNLDELLIARARAEPKLRRLFEEFASVRKQTSALKLEHLQRKTRLRSTTARVISAESEMPGVIAKLESQARKGRNACLALGAKKQKLESITKRYMAMLADTEKELEEKRTALQTIGEKAEEEKEAFDILTKTWTEQDQKQREEREKRRAQRKKERCAETLLHEKNDREATLIQQHEVFTKLSAQASATSTPLHLQPSTKGRLNHLLRSRMLPEIRKVTEWVHTLLCTLQCDAVSCKKMLEGDSAVTFSPCGHTICGKCTAESRKVAAPPRPIRESVVRQLVNVLSSSTSIVEEKLLQHQEAAYSKTEPTITAAGFSLACEELDIGATRAEITILWLSTQPDDMGRANVYDAISGLKFFCLRYEHVPKVSARGKSSMMAGRGGRRESDANKKSGNATVPATECPVCKRASTSHKNRGLVPVAERLNFLDSVTRFIERPSYLVELAESLRELIAV
eukprot:g3372.t1